MTCDCARSLLLETPEGLQRAALWLHLRLCGACRREAGRMRALHTALEGLPRFAPSADLLPALLAIPQHVGRPQAAQKERFNVTRLAYVLTLIIAVTLLAGGILTRSTAPDGATLLLNAAEAMEDIQTLHMSGRGGAPGEHPWGRMSDGSYESWYSLAGSRSNFYYADGSLGGAVVVSIEKGIVWSYAASTKWFPNGVTVVYRVDPKLLALHCATQRERYLNAEVWFKDEVDAGAPVETWEAIRNGQPAKVVEVTRLAPNGDPLFISEYDIDPRTGRLLGLRCYGPEGYGKPMIGYADVLQYGGELADNVFTFTPPAAAAVVEEDFMFFPDPGWFEPVSPSFPQPDAFVEPASDWTPSACVSRDVKLAIDGDYSTFWSVAGPRLAQQGGLWFQLDFGTPIAADKMIIHHGEGESTPVPVGAISADSSSGMSCESRSIPSGGWPRGIRVEYTADGTTWHKAYAGQAAADRPAYAHFGKLRSLRGVRVTLTAATDEEPWVISEVLLYGHLD